MLLPVRAATNFIIFYYFFYFILFYTSLRARIRVHKQQIYVPEYRKIKLSDVCGHRQCEVFPFLNCFRIMS